MKEISHVVHVSIYTLRRWNVGNLRFLTRTIMTLSRIMSQPLRIFLGEQYRDIIGKHLRNCAFTGTNTETRSILSTATWNNFPLNRGSWSIQNHHQITIAGQLLLHIHGSSLRYRGPCCLQCLLSISAWNVRNEHPPSLSSLTRKSLCIGFRRILHLHLFLQLCRIPSRWI